MFEKEAKEYAQGMAMYYESAHGSIPSQFEKYLRKAVEYGYNKAKEWHYVKNGDLPNMNTEVLFYCYGRVKQGLFVGFFKSYYGDHRAEDVIAWKELPVPPKEEKDVD